MGDAFAPWLRNYIEKGRRHRETVTLYVLTLPLPMPIPSKYPTRVWFLGGGIVLRLKNTAEEKFVVNPWTLQQKAQTTQLSLGQFRA